MGSIAFDEKRKNQLIKSVNRLADELCEKLGKVETKVDRQKLLTTFQKCFVNTVETTLECLADKSVFIITGDIEAMWLRDSSAQVAHYLPYLKEEKELAEMVKSLILKQFQYIKIDPYANAFNIEANGNCWAKDETESNDFNWERKYEIDSLCYPVKLLYDYFLKTSDEGIFTEEVKEGLWKIIETWKIEQHHMEQSPYRFVRRNCPPSDTLSSDGLGTPVAYTGMIWCGFRPSDDACQYGYHIPSNLFAVTVLKIIEEFALTIYKDKELSACAQTMKREVEAGIEAYGKVSTKEYGDIYAYEVDGLLHYNLMDDANVPSLLSLPWIGAIEAKNEIYQNTRKFILSKENPYYYEGKAAKGIGSPHTPNQYIWHIALSMQGLTSLDESEKDKLLETLLSTDANTCYMHEGFHCDDPKQYTREWFAWSNSLFALFVIERFALNK